MKYRLQTYEKKGYSDSCGYLIYYDAMFDNVSQVEFWSTAYPSLARVSDAYLWPTIEIAEKARRWLEKQIFEMLKTAEHNDVMEPNNVEKGEGVMLLEDCRNQKKNPVVTKCSNCNGTGRWQNLFRLDDVRECFACEGTGKGIKFEKVPGEWIRWEAGTKFLVKYVQAHGQFYKRGYNQPGRGNRAVSGYTEDGKFIRAPLKKLRLAREMLTDEELAGNAYNLSFKGNFLGVFRGSWVDSDGDFVGPLMKQLEEEANEHSSV